MPYDYTDASKELFGIVFESKAKGFLVGMEFMAIVQGRIMYLKEGEPREEVFPDLQIHQPEYKRISHDMARRLATGGEYIDQSELDRLFDPNDPHRSKKTRILIQKLLQQLIHREPLLRTRKEPTWFGSYFFPYESGLIHHEAVEDPVPPDHPSVSAFQNKDRFRNKNRRSRPNADDLYVPKLRRYQFRDGGKLAFNFLRHDRDLERKEKISMGFKRFLGSSSNSLTKLMEVIQKVDFAKSDNTTRQDDINPIITSNWDSNTWCERFCFGIDNLLNIEVPFSKKMDMIMVWVPYCTARYQIEQAHLETGEGDTWNALCTITDDANLRKKSRDRVRSTENMLRNAYRSKFEDNAEDLPPGFDVGRLMKRVNNYSGFAIGSLALCGALNSLTGSRYFTIKNKLLSTIVAAELDSVSGAGSMALDEFIVDVLFKRHDLIIDMNLTNDGQSMLRIDSSRFENNKAALERRLVETGNARKYSDSTTIIEGVKGSK